MITVVENLNELYELTDTTPLTIEDGDVVYVKGFWDENDGGGGLFAFNKTSELPVYYETGDFGIGFNTNYDGMVCKAKTLTIGRWIRQWDRGKLNLRWFGARPDYSSGRDTSWALNAALKYAQFTVQPFSIQNPNAGQPGEPSTILNPDATLLDSEVYTRPCKTIFIPSGRYKLFSPIIDIEYGVVIEGEGNMGTSQHGTHLLVIHDYTSADDAKIGYDQNISGLFRFIATAEHNSGGGIKNLKILVHSSVTYDTNIISLLSTQGLPDSEVSQDGSGNTYNPAVSKWLGENVAIIMGGKARRAVFMKSFQIDGDLPWRIRDTSLINCWFAGASISGETVRAENSSGLHINGGFFSSGLGVGVDGIAPGIYLGGTYGCANTHLEGVDITHGYVKIGNNSIFTNVNCRFGMLLIYKGDNNDYDHQDLRVGKSHTLNVSGGSFSYPTYTSVLPIPSGYMGYRNTIAIENDIISDLDNLNAPSTTGNWLN